MSEYGSFEDDYAAQQKNPAAPAGLQQAARAEQGYDLGDFGYAGSSLGKFSAESGYASQAGSWFTGRNVEGTNNGWSSTFTDKFIDGQDKAAEQGTLSTYFSQPDATGVVTWDHTGEDGTEYHFGDVFEDGKKVANLYDPAQGGFDRDTANLMMSAWVLDGTQQARIFSDSDRLGRLDREINQVREDNRVNIPKALKAAEVQGRIDERAEEFADGSVDEAIVGGGAVGGGIAAAATTAAGAAALGASWTGPGALVAGIGGALVGGLGAWMNKDELTEKAARAYEITKLASEEEGRAAGITTGLQEWAGFSTSLTTPVTNLTHGLVELTGDNEIGDGDAGFYAVDEHGDSTRPRWAKPLSLGATLIDGITQFASPLARGIYTAQMSGVIGGEVGTLVTTQGKMFDPREGGFDNIFTDDDGNFDPVSAGAGIMKIGVDAVQLGGLRGLALTSKRTGDAARDLTRPTEAAGMKFTFDEAGNVVDKKVNWMAMLAPSEAIASASAARSARVAAWKRATDGGNPAVTADDFYRAATNLANGSNRLKTAVVNGFGEGTEEFVQAFLEPMALDGDIDVSDAIDAYLMGAAGGVGMSLGATASAASSDQKLKAQAYVLETIRRGGEEPGEAEWEQLWGEANDTQKRVMATRSKTDLKLVQQTLARITEDHTATLTATEPEILKANDAKRSELEKAAKTGTDATDTYHVMTAQLSAGEMDVPAEALQGSALTIGRLIEDRMRGMALQEQTLRERLDGAAEPDPADVAERDNLELVRAVGANIAREVLARIDQIYDERTTDDQAQALIEELNDALTGWYRMEREVPRPGNTERFSEPELRAAAAKFITMLHSREPKLDSGSYLALLPQVAWDLTRDDEYDNMLRVNVDVLQAINGDFDGDKLRSEYQLILSDERFMQARAGQLFGGRGRAIDVGEQAFDPQLAMRVAEGLRADSGDLADEATATMENIELALTERYGSLMSPEALDRVFDSFRNAVLATDPDTAAGARVELLNALAREAGGKITELGRTELHNEWLWAAKLVRHHFEAFQTTYARLRARDRGPSPAQAALDLDTPAGVNARKDAAVSDAQTLALFAVGNSLFRKFQKIHYSFFGSRVLKAAGAERADLFDTAALYAEISRNVTRTEMDLVDAPDQVSARVLAMLDRLVVAALNDPDPTFRNAFDPANAAAILANVKVKDVRLVDGEPQLVDDQEISLAQLLLRRALDAEYEEHKLIFDTDEKMKARHARLRAITRPNSEGNPNAERAFIEVFKASAFQDSLGGVTGWLAPHTTPEQWLRNYVSLDPEGRRDLERLYTSHPDYLDRAQSQNLPYQMTEALSRSITPYRSMMDALLAVGRHELTFEPDTPMERAAEAFGGARAEVSKATVAELVDAHTQVRQALAAFRSRSNRSSKDRAAEIDLVRELFRTNPVAGRLVLDLVPDADVNALYESRDGELYVTPWLYETFAIEDPKEAVFHYWSNLMLTKWESLRQQGLENRRYNELNSRFLRLMHDLASEPGQLHLELLLRRMRGPEAFKDIDQFFLWLNRTPGMRRRQQAPLLPFNDDVVDFEADSSGGWSTARAGADLRAAITTLRSAATQMRTTVEFREEKRATDKVLRDGIRRALAGDPDGDYEALRKFRKALEVSLVLPRGFAPSAMLALTNGAMSGLSAHSTDKGTPPDTYAGLGEFQVLMDAFAFVPGLERTMELLTAHSVAGLRAQVGELGKHAGVGMDAHGRQIEWDQLTVEEALDLLDNPATEELALTLLTPQALDVVNGKLVERQLFDASLMDLLAGETYTDLFDLEGAGALNNAMRYLSVLESRANAEGGNFSVMRYATSLAITRMSGLSRESTAEDRARITTQAYLDTARALQLLGQIQATPEMAAEETFKELLKSGKTLLRDAATRRKLPGFVEQVGGSEVLVKTWVEEMLSDLEDQQLEQHQEAAERYEGDELDRRLAAIDATYEVNAARVRALLEDDLTGAIVNRFAVTGDPFTDAAAHAQIVEYALAHGSPQRMPESIEIWQKLATQRFNGQLPDLTADEWDQLSRSVMGLYLVDQVLQVATHVSIPPFGKGDPAVSETRFHKYFDPAYTFIATDLLANPALAAAAGWLHAAAEQPRSLLSIEQMTATLKRTVLNDQALGAWTPGQMAQIVEAHERMDSSPVAGAVAAAGNGPKRWAAVAFATRRNGDRVPGPELLTTAVFDSSLLDDDADVFSEIGVTPAGSTEEISMPVAQLDNRFVAAIRVDGVEVPLHAENLGFTWHGEVTPSGYRYISLERLRPVLARLTGGGSATVEIDFFHPDSRPADPEWANSVYFDGMAHSLLPDGAESLIAAFWSANAGRVAEDTQLPLDAGKEGAIALTPFTRPDPAAVAEAEAHWVERNDMAAMLRAKTELLIAGDETLTPSDYNALYKMLGLQHIVVGVRKGKRVALTAAEVIAARAADPASPLDLEGAKLVKLSPDVLRTMLGETGDQGANRYLEDEYLFNPDLVAEFTGITDGMIARFPGWFAETGRPGDTELANVARARTLTVRTLLTDAERNARQERREFLDARASEVRAARYTKLRGAKDALNGYVATIQLAIGAIVTERNDFAFMDAGIPIAARNTAAGASHTRKLLERLEKIVKRDDYNRGWRVVDDGTPSLTPDRSVLTVETLDEDRPLEHQIVKDDFALLELNSFRRFTDPVVNLDRVEKALRYLVGTGATIALGSGNGAGDKVRYAAQYLREHGYSRVAGSQHLFAPTELVDQTQNEKAYASTLTETRTLAPARTAVTFLTKDPIGTTQNSAVPNRKSRKLRDRKLVNNILRSSGIGHFNLPLDTGGDSNLYSEALAQLRTVTDPANAEARERLLKQGGTDPGRLMPLADALNRFHDRITRSSTLVPEEGEQIEVGDIIPFLSADGKVILYRHGFKPPKATDLNGLFKDNPLNVVVGRSEPDPEATANTGVIRRIEDAPGYGKRLLIEVPLQLGGDKIQLEWNGMKYVLTPGSEKLDRYLDVPIFPNGLRVDLLADYASAAAKEAYEGLVVGYRNALAFFQFDFTEDLVKFFYPDVATRPAQAEILVYSLLEELSVREDLKIPQRDAVILSRAHVAVADTLAEFAAVAGEKGPDPDWADRLGVDQDASTQIARAVITYLLTHGAHLDNVLKSAGFSHPRADSEAVSTRLVPGLFADLLDQGATSAVHTELIRRFDAQLSSLPGGAGMKLRPDWTVEIYDGSEESLEGFLQFGEIHSSGDNPVLNAAADARATQAGVSPHNALAAALSVGAITATKGFEKLRSFTRSFDRSSGVVKPGTEEARMWEMLTALPAEKDDSLAGWRRETPPETVRRALARQELVGFYAPLDDDAWSPTERAEYEAQVAKILSRLNLYGSQRALVDTWVRMHLGRPSNRGEDGHDPGTVAGRDAVEIAKKVWNNVDEHLLPTAGARVPLLDVNHLTVIYLANRHRDGGWSPRTTLAKDAPARATSWDAWVDTAFGTTFGMTKDSTGPVPEPRFHQMYLLAVDGLMHGYQGATSSTRYLPVSSDVLRQRALMDPETSRMLVSISDDENLLATDATLFNAISASLDDIVGGQRIYAAGRGAPDPASAQGRQEHRINDWHREANVPRQRGQKVSDIRAAGQTFLGYTTDTHAFWRSAHNLRVGNTLLNPLLILSAPLEAYYRRSIDTFSDLLSGQATGAVGKLQARAGEKLLRNSFAEWLGVELTYTVEELDRIGKLADALSTMPEFKALIYRELMHQYPTIPGIGKVEKWLESYAKFGARLQDPAIGMRPKDLARIYVKTALRRIAADPTGENVYSVQMLLTQLARNPEWLRGQDVETHNMAIATIANIRSLKPSVISLATRGIIEPLSGSTGGFRNTAGNMLKLLTTFQNFWANSVINLTGMQGVADFAAFHLDGRKKSKLIRRFQAALAGEEFVPEEDERFDMSEVIESVDLADSFIRSGVTHTSLFLFGMMAGELGLGGEDEEERWRRRAAELQGAGFVHDPREASNSFLNKGAIFLNWLPDGLESWFKVDPNDPNSDALAQMNWTMKYFMSPILGFERFYRTGDFSEVILGFGDAIGSHPIVNSTLWKETVDTASELHAASNDAVEKGDMPQAAHLLVTAVSTFERMMLENATVNMIYTGVDRYDRDPYKLPARDSDRNLQGDVRGNPYQTNEALTSVVDDNGTPDNPADDFVRQEYVDRDGAGALLRSYTENRFGLAFLGSLVTGVTGGGFTGSDMLRYNMPVKTRTVELAPQDQDELEAYVLAAFQGAGGQVNLTEGEAAQRIKNLIAASGRRWDATEVEKLAADMSAASGMAELSRIDEAGREHLTDDGARAVFDGLRSGATTLGTAPLNGVYMTKEQRDKIRDSLVRELVQEGVDLGLNKDQATWRMRRIMFGTGTEADTPALIDLLYTDQIPWTDTLEYNQLNTTYLTGPNGFPMSTGFTREGLLGAFGLKQLMRPWQPVDTGLEVDGVLNSVDTVAGINTGLRALEPRPASWEVPRVEDEIRKAAEDVVSSLKDIDFTPSEPYAKGGYGGGGYRRRGGYGGGGGGGGYFSNPYKLYALPGNRVPYGNSVPFINTSNPIIRRADIRRERVWSERGRLNQWQ